MKATSKISKREVMTRAWRIFRGRFCPYKTFGECLKRAWELEKEKVALKIKEAEITPVRVNNHFDIDDYLNYDSMQSYYNNGVYSGD